MGKVYCKYCGREYPDERALLANNCQCHPDGRGKQVQAARLGLCGRGRRVRGRSPSPRSDLSGSGADCGRNCFRAEHPRRRAG